jgi:hypothetical protein
MLQTLSLTTKNEKKSSFYEEKSLVGLTPGVNFSNILRAAFLPISYSKKSFTP